MQHSEIESDSNLGIHLVTEDASEHTRIAGSKLKMHVEPFLDCRKFI